MVMFTRGFGKFLISAIFYLAIPSPEALVNAAVRVACRFLGCELLFHALHSGTEAVTTRPAFGLRGLEPRLAGVCSIIGC